MVLKHRKQTFFVKDFAEASAIFDGLRDESGEGGSTFGEGRIYDDAGKMIARISYNGRVWKAGPWKDGDVPLYDNRTAGAA